MNTQLKSILAKKLAKKGRKPNGFTLIEIMVVVAIVGVLSAVALPQLTKAQDRAKSSAAEQEVVNQGKTCAIALLSSESYSPVNPVTGTCAAGGSLVSDGGGKRYTITIDANGIPGTPAETETPT